MKRVSLSLFLLSTALLSACGHYSEQLAAMDSEFDTPTVYAQNETALNQVTPAAGGDTGMAYNRALAQAYHARAVEENQKMDYTAAKYFTGKAYTALHGQIPAPGQPAEFGIARADSTELTEAREKLVTAIKTQNTPENQQALVQAQIDYDGWLDQQAENKTGAALTCKDGFMQALAQIEDPYVENRRYGIFFNPGQTALGEGSAQIIADVAGLVSQNADKPYQIVLTDKVPGAQSAQRIQSVQDALTAQGVKAQSIVVSSTEAAPATAQPVAYSPTPEAVEIVIKFAPSATQVAPVPPQQPVPAASPTPFLKSPARSY